MSKKNSQLSLIKHAFFNHSPKEKPRFNFKDDNFDLDQLRFEYSTLYQLFLSNPQQWSIDLTSVYYLNYLCELMICYHRYDYIGSELKKLKKQKKEIEAFIDANSTNKKQESINQFAKLFLTELKTMPEEHLHTIIGLSKIRNYVGNINAKRSHFSYSRALATQLINFLEKSPIFNLIQNLNKILGNQYNFIEVLNLLNNSRETIALLGVTLFTIRFIINLTLLLKHLINAAIDHELSVNKGLRQELEKRAFIMASDLVWAVVGLLTTYNNYFNISSLHVSSIILSFLVFDVLLLFAQWFFEATKHNQRLQELLMQKNDATPSEQTVITRQIDILNDEWESKSAYYAINITGANLLVICFAIPMFYAAGPLTIACLALFSMLGNALYNSSEEFRLYQQAKIAVKRELANREILNDTHHKDLIKELNQECNQRYNDYWQSLAFNVGGIAFIITAAVVSWPIALCLTAAYLLYQLNNNYQKHLEQEPKKVVSHDIYRFLPSISDKVSISDNLYATPSL